MNSNSQLAKAAKASPFGVSHDEQRPCDSMRVNWLARILLWTLAGAFSCGYLALAAPGDADGNGQVDIDDARTIARFLVGQLPAIPNSADADATQDGVVDMEDAFAIAQRLTGQSRFITVAPVFGNAQSLNVGRTIRVEVFERFFPLKITGGSLRIQSASTGYDSGAQPLSFERDGRSLYFHWDTAGLSPADDFSITVSLTESFVSGVRPAGPGAPDAIVVLSQAPTEPAVLASSIDASCPAPGLPLEFRRVFPHDSANFPYLGPLGRGWMHNFDVHLQEFTDGRIAFLGANGFNRWFKSKADGTYTATPGDYAILSRDPDATFQLREKDGMIYRFRPDLRLDYLQDRNGNRITAVYNPASQLVEIRHSSGDAFQLRYNPQGRITNVIDHAGRSTTYEYHPAVPEHLIRAVLPGDHTNSYAYSLGQGIATDHRLLSFQAHDGVQRYYAYAPDGHVSSQEGAWGSGRLVYSYSTNGLTRMTDLAGGIAEITVNDQRDPILIRRPDGGIVRSEYDSARNIARVVDAAGNTNRFAYDTMGNRTATTNAEDEVTSVLYEPVFQQPVMVIDPLGRTNVSHYDASGNLTASILPDGTTRSFVYDAQGNRIVSTDGAGKTTRLGYNRFGAPTAVTNALGNVNTFAYDSAGSLVAFTNASGNPIRSTRDGLGRITRRTYSDGSHENVEYDEGGRVSATTNRRGQRVTLAYDPNGRLEYKSYPSGRQLRFRYDPRGLFSGVEELADGARQLQVQYDHDLMGRLTSIKVPGKAVPETYDVAFAYDPAGRRTLVAYPDGYIVRYEYDRADRLHRITDANANLLVAYQYDAAGRRVRRTLGNGTFTTYEYDSADRLLRLSNFSPDATVQSRFEYTYNASGLRTAVASLEGLQTHEYDDIYQLTKVTYADNSVVRYAFDASGNRTNVNTGATASVYVVNSLDQYSQAGADSLQYDQDGNLSRRVSGAGTSDYSWDEDNRLVQVLRNGREIRYRYDHQGRLIEKAADGVTNRYVWDSRHLIAQIAVASGAVKRFIYGTDIDEVLLIAETDSNSWIQHDAQGSVVGVTDDGGNVLFQCAYDAYGNVRSGGTGSSPRRFAGMLWDDDAGLYYVRSRWYSALEGRFVQPDPIGLEGGFNLYVYAANSPINFVDPLGLWYIAITFNIPGSPWGGTFTFGPGGWTGGPSYGPGFGGGAFLFTGNASPGVSASGWAAYGVGAMVAGNVGGPSDAGFGIGYGGGVSIGGSVGGGTCPTFIQLPPTQPPHARTAPEVASKASLLARIAVPVNRALLRSDVPIYGIAAGQEFARFRLEYGEGVAPIAWHTINSSTTAQSNCSVTIADIPSMQGDVDLRGNLGTWNTGLKNWVHLPWHPPEDSTDFNGVYTIRLLVEGQDGKSVEDRITCEIGRAIAQCVPGIAISPDRLVTMRFPEQALIEPFRVYTILPLSLVGETAGPPHSGVEFVSEIYRIREPGDRFIQDVVLEFAADAKPTLRRDANHVGLCRYDYRSRSWVWLKTTHDASLTKFQTILSELPAPRAIYALAYDAQTERSSRVDVALAATGPMLPLKADVLAEATFEKDLGTFKPRDRWVGAVLSRDNKATPDGTYCLKLVKENAGGNFSVTVLDRPFDAQDYPILSFDYKITADVKTDFLLKVAGRWYNLRFTDDPINYRNRDVNIANLGSIEGVLADGAWHKAIVDLRSLLGRQTHHTRIEEIVMADWDVTGFMKLEFGHNARGATYYLDNFKIAAGATPWLREMPVNDFARAEKINLLRGPSGSFSNPGTDYCQMEIVDDASGTNRNQCLKLTYDTSRAGAYCGYWTALMAPDLSEMEAVRFRLRAAAIPPPMLAGLRHAPSRAEARVPVQPYLGAADRDGWRIVAIPLSAFLGRGLPGLTLMDTLFFTFENAMGSGSGTVFMDDVQFSRKAAVGAVADIDAYPAEVNLLGGGFRTSQTGAAAISAGYHEDRAAGAGEKQGCVRISYGGKIGHDYGQGQFSYAIWETDLMGIDARDSSELILRIRGEKGGEKPNIYLDDGHVRRTVRARELPPLTTQWQDLHIPLEKYGQQGLDLSHLTGLQLDFEWEEMSGTIYVSKVYLAPREPKEVCPERAHK